MRRIVLDTETTGLEPEQGHRIIEIACLELYDRRPTGRHFHRYVNPERDIDIAATQVHGLTAEDLADKPRFADIADELLEFLDDAELLIHNAPFDVAFLNAELARIAAARRSRSLCTRDRHAGAGARAASGQAATRSTRCASATRWTTRKRTLHGALLDTQLLAEVWLAPDARPGRARHRARLADGRCRRASSAGAARAPAWCVRASADETRGARGDVRAHRAGEQAAAASGSTSWPQPPAGQAHGRRPETRSAQPPRRAAVRPGR